MKKWNPYGFVVCFSIINSWKKRILNMNSLDKPIRWGMVCSKQIHKSVDAVFLWFIFNIGGTLSQDGLCGKEVLTVVEALALKTFFRWSGMLLKHWLAQCQLSQISWKKPKPNQNHCCSEMSGLFFYQFWFGLVFPHHFNSGSIILSSFWRYICWIPPISNNVYGLCHVFNYLVGWVREFVS